jgi:hypothetical protein
MHAHRQASERPQSVQSLHSVAYLSEERRLPKRMKVLHGEHLIFKRQMRETSHCTHAFFIKHTVRAVSPVVLVKFSDPQWSPVSARSTRRLLCHPSSINFRVWTVLS